MNIALFLDCFTPMKNGVITSALQLKEGLEKKGHHVVIVAVRVEKYDAKNPDIMLVPMIPFDFGSKQGFGLGLVSRRKLLAFLKQHKVELIHCHTEFGVGLAGKWAAKKLGLPRVTTTHTMWEMYSNYNILLKIKFIWRSFFRFFMKGTGVIVAPSLKAKKYDNMVVPGVPVQIVPNGIDMKKFKAQHLTKKDIENVRKHYGLKAGDHCLIFVGRIGPEKRVEELLDLVVPVLKKNDHAKMIFVGDGPSMAKLKDKTKKQGLEGSVVFTGFVNWDEVYRLYSISDMFVTASLSEVHPMTMIEGAMCGLPCLSRRDDSYADLIREGVNGYMADTDRELAARIEELLADPKKHKKFSEASLKHSQMFTADNHAKRMEKLYKKVIELYPNKLKALFNPKILD